MKRVFPEEIEAELILARGNLVHVLERGYKFAYVVEAIERLLDVKVQKAMSETADQKCEPGV